MSGISGISSSMSYGMAPMRRPDPQEMFKKVDSDSSGGVSQTELQTLTEKISENSGQSLDAAKLLSEYDSNSDGSLGQDEMNSLMESIRPKHEREAMMQKNSGEGNSSSGLDAQSMASYLSNSGQDLVSNLISMLQELQSAMDEDGTSSLSAVNGRQEPPPPPPPHGQGELSQNNDNENNLQNLLKLLKNYSSGTASSQSINIVS